MPIRLIKIGSSLNSFLGHGRALESYLVGVKLLFVFFIVIPHQTINMLALQDLRWWMSAPIIAIPFFCIGLLQLVGLVLNYKGYEYSWAIRCVGASLGTCMWFWIIIKNIAISEYTAGTMPFCIMSCMASTWIWWKAWNRLPIPGSSGLT